MKLSTVLSVCWPLILLLVFTSCRTTPASPTPEAATRGASSLPNAALASPPVPETVVSTSPVIANNSGSQDPTNMAIATTASPTRTPTATSSPSSTPSPTFSPSSTPTPSYPVYTGPPLNRFDAGIQLHIHREDIEQLFDYVRTLGLGWVKNQVSWKLYQPAPDLYDDYRWAELDKFVETAEREGVKVMLSVAKAPEWSRSTAELDGPPDDSATFQAFMNYLATRYRGRVDAYELWNEPNLQREWNGKPLNAEEFVNLIRAGAAGVRQVDSEVVLVSGAPATTGINDGVTAIDDRIYLTQMVAAGVTTFVDAIGVHPYGWANPPDSSSSDAGSTVPSHNNHPSFFFLDTLRDYQRILDETGNPDLPIWVTEFGWGSYEGLGIPPPESVAYMAYVNEQQQANYTLRAFELANQDARLGPMIVWNLNFGLTLGAEYPVSAYSVIRPDGSYRPIFYALSAIQWVEESSN